ERSTSPANRRGPEPALLSRTLRRGAMDALIRRAERRHRSADAVVPLRRLREQPELLGFLSRIRTSAERVPAPRVRRAVAPRRPPGRRAGAGTSVRAGVPRRQRRAAVPGPPVLLPSADRAQPRAHALPGPRGLGARRAAGHAFRCVIHDRGTLVPERFG